MGVQESIATIGYYFQILTVDVILKDVIFKRQLISIRLQGLTDLFDQALSV